MKLLILTQKVDKNDSNLGFFYSWIEEFAKNCEKLTVICLYKGECDLPDNVKVLSLGKEKNVSRLKYLFNFYKYIWLYRKKYDSVFVHMNQIYVILGACLWRFLGKKIGLWYTHKNISFSLKIAEKLTNFVFTASQNSFRLKSKKVKVVGHGIDVNKFTPNDKIKTDSSIFNIVTVGRISPIKKYEELIEAIENLTKKDNKYKKIKVKIIGGPINDFGKKYFEELKNLVILKNLNNFIEFIGPVKNIEVINFLRESDLFVHMCKEGGLDKVVLEAMACEVLVLSNNYSVKNDVLFDFENFLYYQGNNELIEKIDFIMNMEEEKKEIIIKKLRKIVIDDHNLSNLIINLLKTLNEKTSR